MKGNIIMNVYELQQVMYQSFIVEDVKLKEEQMNTLYDRGIMSDPNMLKKLIVEYVYAIENTIYVICKGADVLYYQLVS